MREKRLQIPRSRSGRGYGERIRHPAVLPSVAWLEGDEGKEVEMTESYKGEAYCVKCKEKRQFEGTVKVSDSGRRMAQGICPVCGTKVNRILGKA